MHRLSDRPRPDLGLPEGPVIATMGIAPRGVTGFVFQSWYMVLLVFGVISGNHLDGPAYGLLASATGAWLVWLLVRYRFKAAPEWMLPAALAVVAGAGGVLTGWVTLAMIYPAIAAIAIAIARPVRQAAWVLAVGPIAQFIAVPLRGHNIGIAVGGLTAVLGGTILGLGRRQTAEQAARTAALQVAEAKAEAEAARAELLAGRNHFARELHDVLAHSLSALSLQLEALGATIGNTATPEVEAQLDGIKRLVREGLNEARGAVAALREDVPPLHQRLAEMAESSHATLQVAGDARDVQPDASHTLYRAAQEALTNVRKHAPGQTAAITLTYAPHQVTLVVSNPITSNGTSPIASSGGGYGLQGIKERVLLLGGTVQAGPSEGEWKVAAEVPA